MQPATHSAYLHQLSSVAKAPSTFGKTKEVLIFKSLYAVIQECIMLCYAILQIKADFTRRIYLRIYIHILNLILHNLSMGSLKISKKLN